MAILATVRATVIDIRSDWATMSGWGRPLDLVVNDQTLDAVKARLRTQQVDGYDYLLLEAMQKAGIAGIITDDVDFVTVPGIFVFTANLTALDLAFTQKKLLYR
jgi:predicted nucleic acid-binding protein